MFDNTNTSGTDNGAHSGIELGSVMGKDSKMSWIKPQAIDKEDHASTQLPALSLREQEIAIKKADDAAEQNMSIAFANLPAEEQSIVIKAEQELLNDDELEAPFGDSTRKALMKDADLFPAVKNDDGTTTYSVIQIGITDRNPDRKANYFSRKVDITVPVGAPSLNDCKFNFNDREVISEEKYKQLLKKDAASSKDIDLYTHGVSATDKSADKQALMLELSNGRPTVNIDWSSNPPADKDPVKALIQYERDTASAKRANDNKEFTAAIDNTIKEVGAGNCSMIGFSHGGMFDTRYLKHRVQSHLPELNTVILTHPDVPISAPELWNGFKPRVLADSAVHSYVIGSQNDLALKMGHIVGYLPGGTTYEHGLTEERLGDYSWLSRLAISTEGAVAIQERDQHKISTHHFLNYAGIKQLLESGNDSKDKVQTAYNHVTDLARQNPRAIAQIIQDNIADGLPLEGSSNFRGSGEAYPYPSQTDYSSPNGSGDYNPYKYQDGNIYK